MDKKFAELEAKMSPESIAVSDEIVRRLRSAPGVESVSARFVTYLKIDIEMNDFRSRRRRNIYAIERELDAEMPDGSSISINLLDCSKPKPEEPK